VAFASGALLAVYFLPAWRIDLFAPQYPEGLSMYIWINKITGDVDIINGLNHYIGMKHISPEMFPEFTYLPYVVAFFILLGLTAAVIGNRKILLAYILLTLIGGILVPYDLYRWGYAYGHELDPKAAIQVPGLSYQPPVFGHKRLLNFDAYSFPDVAGWIVVGAGLLAAGVLIYEWWHHRRSGRRTAYAASLLLVPLFFSSCTAGPAPFEIGKDNCQTCKMGIADLKYGGEVISRKGKVYKFDDMGCMLQFLADGSLPEQEIKSRLVMNYENPNEFLDVSTAFFLSSPTLNTPMNSHLAGFSSRAAAEKSLATRTGEILRWEDLSKKEN